MRIEQDDPRREQIAGLLRQHLTHMRSISPPGSVHALDIEALRGPAVTFWSVWEGDELLGCGALQELEAGHGEIKSMRTADAHRRKGVAARLLTHIITEARRRGYHRLSLETGSTAHFAAARSLYARFGFEPCGPFAGYREDPHSAFMTLRIR